MHRYILSAHFDRLDLFWCSTSKIFRCRQTERTMRKCQLCQHYCFYQGYKLLYRPLSSIVVIFYWLSSLDFTNCFIIRD